MTTDAIQEYQAAKQRHRQAEIDIAKAKAQVEIYQKDIANILASEGVSTVEELANKYQEELERLKTVTNVLNQEITKANEILSKLGANQ